VAETSDNLDEFPSPLDHCQIELLGEYLAQAGLLPDGRHVIEAAHELVKRYTDIGFSRMVARGDCSYEPLAARFGPFPAPLADPDAEQYAKESRHLALVATAASLANRLDELREQIRGTPGELDRIDKSIPSTTKGGARERIIAAFTLHHQYADGGCLNWEPIDARELQRKAGLTSATSVSRFFKDEFLSHDSYKRACVKNQQGVLTVLMKLNNELPTSRLFARTPPGEGPRHDDE
jgi:hypothetical protein